MKVIMNFNVIYFIGDTSLELVMEFLVTDLDLGDNSQMTFNLEQNFQGYFGVRNIEKNLDKMLR